MFVLDLFSLIDSSFLTSFSHSFPINLSYFTDKGLEESNIVLVIVVGVVVCLPVVVVPILFIFCYSRFAKQQKHSGSVNTTTPASQQPFVSFQSQDDRVNAKTLETEKCER